MDNYNIIIKLISKIPHFYTHQSFVYHLLFIFGIIPSTKYIAYLVLIVSQIFAYIYPKYINIVRSKLKFILIDSIIHIIPALFIYFYNSHKVPLIDISSVSILLFSLIVYITYIHLYLKTTIFNIYIDPFKYLNLQL
jgi:hypothetical protein